MAAEISKNFTAALAVGCPDCMAEPGEPCFNDGGTEYVPAHGQRVAAVGELVDRAQELYEAQDGGPMREPS